MRRFAYVNPSTTFIESVSVAEEGWSETNWHEVGDRPAVIGGTYVNGVFILPQPYPSWGLDSNKDWQPPIVEPIPTDVEKAAGKYYVWNEALYQSDNTKGWVIGTYTEHHS